MKRMILASKVVLISCMLLACTAGDEISNKASQTPAHIVIVAPFSGPLSKFGRSMLRGGRMRVEEGEDQHIMDWLAIQTYDAVDLLLWAANKWGLGPTFVRGALHGVSSENSSIRGLAGPIYFNPDGSLARGVSVATYTGSRWKARQNEH